MYAAQLYYSGISHTIHGWLFQAKMWRDGRRTSTGIGRDWMASISGSTRQ